MKQSIAWHRSVLENMRGSLSYRQRELERAQDNYDLLAASIQLTERQIAEAERQGKDSFDTERFLVPRKPRG
jgi:hypothetical protein